MGCGLEKEVSFTEIRPLEVLPRSDSCKLWTLFHSHEKDVIVKKKEKNYLTSGAGGLKKSVGKLKSHQKTRL